MHVTLPSGLTVSIAAFHCQSTSTFMQERGVLEGSPKGLNRYLLKNAPAAMERLWGKKKTFLVMPDLPIIGGDDPHSAAYRQHLELDLLPPYLFHAWLQERIGSPEEGTMRELVVAFFRNDFDETIQAMVRKASKTLDWNASAVLVESDW
jgi:hypothetical protein